MDVHLGHCLAQSFDEKTEKAVEGLCTCTEDAMDGRALGPLLGTVLDKAEGNFLSGSLRSDIGIMW